MGNVDSTFIFFFYVQVAQVACPPTYSFIAVVELREASTGSVSGAVLAVIVFWYV